MCLPKEMPNNVLQRAFYWLSIAKLLHQVTKSRLIINLWPMIWLLTKSWSKDLVEKFLLWIPFLVFYRFLPLYPAVITEGMQRFILFIPDTAVVAFSNNIFVSQFKTFLAKRIKTRLVSTNLTGHRKTEGQIALWNKIFLTVTRKTNPKLLYPKPNTPRQMWWYVG